MWKIFLMLLLLVSTSAFSEDKYATNLPDVYVKNFSCSASKATFNVVNKSSKYVSSVFINIFDGDGDPIDKRQISLGIAPNSGKADYTFLDCSKLSRIGFSANSN